MSTYLIYICCDNINDMIPMLTSLSILSILSILSTLSTLYLICIYMYTLGNLSIFLYLHNLSYRSVLSCLSVLSIYVPTVSIHPSFHPSIHPDSCQSIRPSIQLAIHHWLLDNVLSKWVGFWSIHHEWKALEWFE